jgi:hypothetical protein
VARKEQRMDEYTKQERAEARELLIRARALIATPGREMPDAYATLHRVYVDAMRDALGPRATILRLACDRATEALADAIPHAAPRRKAACPDHVAIMNYNSNATTTRQDLLALFDRALAHLDDQLAQLATTSGRRGVGATE